VAYRHWRQWRLVPIHGVRARERSAVEGRSTGDKTFRRWEPDQQILFPPSIKDFVPKGHLAHFVRDVVRDDLDLSAIFAGGKELGHKLGGQKPRTLSGEPEDKAQSNFTDPESRRWSRCSARPRRPEPSVSSFVEASRTSQGSGLFSAPYTTC